MTAREEILARAREAVAGAAAPAAVPAAARERAGDLAGLFRERVEDYRATVTRCGADGVVAAVADVLARHEAGRVVAPEGLELRGLEHVPATPEDLQGVDGVVTACALAIAETGTIVLDCGAGQGPRILTLLPDLHVCIVREAQIVADVGDAIERLAGVTAPITFISGPSATSDIELERVEGVHGPRRLEVVLSS